MPTSQRHTEFFGPDLGRGPFASSRVDAAAIQIATALAQVRAPLGRSDAELLAHGDFIRQLADRLAPDFAAYLAVEVGPQTNDTIDTTFRTALDAHSLLELWLADQVGEGETAAAPGSVSVVTGTLLETVTFSKRLRVLTDGAGIATVRVTYAAGRTWYWGVSRAGRVIYSRMQFY